MVILCVFFVHALSCSIFIFIFGTHVIIQTRDIIKGVLVGNEAKEAKIQKKNKANQKVAKNGILTKRLLENQRVRENQKQGTRSCFLTK